MKNSSTQTDTGSDQKEGIKALSETEILSKKSKSTFMPIMWLLCQLTPNVSVSFANSGTISTGRFEACIESH